MQRPPPPVSRDRRGLATLEFAVSLPLVLLLTFGMADVVRLGRGHLRAQNVAMQVGQIMSQCEQINGGDTDALGKLAKRLLGTFVANGERWELKVTAFGQDSGGSAFNWTMPPVDDTTVPATTGVTRSSATLTATSKGTALPTGPGGTPYQMGRNKMLFRTEVFVSVDNTFLTRRVSALLKATPFSTAINPGSPSSVRGEAIHTTRNAVTDRLRTNTGSQGCLT